LSVEAAKLLNYSARMKIVAEDPVSVAEFFNHFIEIVIEKVFKKGLFGQYLSHYGVVETQGRGGTASTLFDMDRWCSGARGIE
jgi:hypothetical protein